MKNPKIYFYACKNYAFNIRFTRRGLRWKDKFGTPRCESVPYLEIEFLWWVFRWSRGDDQFWEQKLWIDIWHAGDEEKAKKDWGWVDMETKKSTWIDY